MIVLRILGLLALGVLFKPTGRGASAGQLRALGRGRGVRIRNRTSAAMERQRNQAGGLRARALRARASRGYRAGL